MAHFVIREQRGQAESDHVVEEHDAATSLLLGQAHKPGERGTRHFHDRESREFRTDQ